MTQLQWLETLKDLRSDTWAWVLEQPARMPTPEQAAVLYPFEETRKALYEGAKRAVAAIPHCKPYRLAAPIKAKKQFLVFGKDGSESKLVTKEGVIEDALHIWEF